MKGKNPDPITKGRKVLGRPVCGKVWTTVSVTKREPSPGTEWWG